MRKIPLFVAGAALAGCATAAQHFQKQPPTPCEAATAALSDAGAFEAFARSVGNPLLIATAIAARAGAEELVNQRCQPIVNGV